MNKSHFAGISVIFLGSVQSLKEALCTLSRMIHKRPSTGSSPKYRRETVVTRHLFVSLIVKLAIRLLEGVEVSSLWDKRLIFSKIKKYTWDPLDFFFHVYIMKIVNQLVFQSFGSATLGGITNIQGDLQAVLREKIEF